ncbi:MAG: hypothetical protein FGM54_04250 [Chitinophagaceae bacterium]|nr:hypothetical protein [Chitinophagaceae bacterium]
MASPLIRPLCAFLCLVLFGCNMIRCYSLLIIYFLLNDGYHLRGYHHHDDHRRGRHDHRVR